MNKNIKIIGITVALVLSSCASYSPKYKVENFDKTLPVKEIEKTFYLVGDAGYAKINKSTNGLIALKKVLDTSETKNDYLIFLGDNIYQKGMPEKESPERELSEHRINAQVDAAKNFEGEMIFIPGNHDWYNEGLKGLKRQEKYVAKKLNTKNAFLPEKGCPIESVKISDKVHLLILDTQWYLANWDKNPTINDNCEIKTREKFFSEIEGELKKHSKKTIVIAMHHPMYTNGPHGGKYSFDKHIFPSKKKIPLPFLGSLATLIRSQGGVTAQDLSNVMYNGLKRRLTTMTKGLDKVVYVSGHEHSLQYIEDGGVKQIVSGSGAKVSAASLGKDGLFSYPGQGFAILDVYTDGSSNVRFYGNEKGEPKLVYQTEIHKKKEVYNFTGVSNTFDKEATASIYAKEEVEKSKLFKSMWGDHYRYLYGTDITVPVATLDTLLGGLTIDRQGGGQVTRSLRLIDKDGKQYSLRAMRKSVAQFLQKGAFKNTYVGDGFDDTLTEDLLSDFYTSSYPYAFLTVGPLADAIGVYHANPKLYYVPKHPALGEFNENFGDEIYFLEERPSKEYGDLASFGKPDDIESTDDLLRKMRRDEKYQMDEENYIKARLFDMILGDWDRHPDQWRWARFDKEGEKVYRPIPRDRDQVFSNYDGVILDILKFVVPITRKFQVYDDELKKIRWINESGIRLDRTLAQNSGRETWLKQANYIKENLSDKIIEEAFNNLPEETQDETAEKIKRDLRARRDQIIDIANRYYTYLSKHVIIKGTDKDDYFEIVREDKKTIVRISRIKGGEAEKPHYERVFNSGETKEIWIYGLDDDDKFLVKGKGSNPIKIRIVGGQNNDEYTIENGRKIKIYDHKSKPNTVKKKGGAKFIFSNIYSYNIYDYNKYIDRTNVFTPFIGFNPDDGLNINVTDTYTVRGFKNDPYHSKHKFTGAYYFATEGYALSYSGEFADAIGNWNILLNGVYTSENFAQNFFGFGNNTVNPDDELGLDYNRVKTGIWSVGLGISKKGYYGSEVSISASYEGIEVQNTGDRFITSGLGIVNADPDFFERKFFTNLDVQYKFESYDNPVNPARGMLFSVQTGARMNVEDTDRTYGYINPKIGFYNAITRNQKLVLKTDVMAEINIGDSFEFYQGANLGGTKGLRGYREERFTGESALAFSSDLRYSFNQFKTGLLPLQLGLFGGYDIGRVWLDGEDSSTWHDSVGGGLWINGVDAIAGQLGAFNSDDGLRFTFGLGLSF
ncbi:metallophosphoesterase [Aquimarina sp. 2201CG5-10]|uniref:metallophosphoesterase n=1 Tax=Aquimarina callyspongiae TaxID=3098150 RepID=UPI002AB4B022|nr:metallophosphoesterase [Aquimarina sp. 2201CG5-10]MDY8138946.1 metallophosphoesterase [Aquimarina sp. 2201CG5-10]